MVTNPSIESDAMAEDSIPSRSSSSSSGYARRALNVISIEPAIFLASLGYGFQSVISQNLILEKVCKINMNYDEWVCNNLTDNKEVEEAVEQVAASISMYLNVLTAIPAVIVSLFLGPWSDVNGRKPLMIVPMIGTMVSQIFFILNTYFSSWQAEYIMLSSLGSLFGGFTGFLIGIYSYISDKSSGRARTSRIALLDLFVFLGFPVGTFVSGPLFKYGGYYAVFGLAAALTFASMMYVIVFIKDTRGPYSDEGRGEGFDLLGAFSLWNVYDVFRTCLKRRENYTRSILILLIWAMLFNLSTISSSSLIYLLTRINFKWTEQDFTVWVAATSVVSSFASFCVMPILSYRMKINDTIIGIIGAIFGVASNLIRTFATKPWMFYLSSGVGLISTTPPIVIRSFLSKVTPADELGRIFSLVASLEACVPLVTSPLMTYIYKSTIDTFPSAILLVSAFLYLFIIFNLSLVELLVRLGNRQVSEDRVIIVENETIASTEEEEEDNES